MQRSRAHIPTQSFSQWTGLLLLCLLSACHAHSKYTSLSSHPTQSHSLVYQNIRPAPAEYPPPQPLHASNTSDNAHTDEQPSQTQEPPLQLTEQHLQQYSGGDAQHSELPPHIQAFMPLHSWAKRLFPFSSPRLSTCRPKILSRARRDIGKRTFKCTRYARSIRYRNDCSGWVRCVYSHFGIDMFYVPGVQARSGTYLLFNYLRNHGFVHRGVPASGDLVFWHSTTDRNNNGRLDDDPLTHVGLVERVDEDGRVQILHTGYKPRPGVHRIYMYLKNPSLYRKNTPKKATLPKTPPKIKTSTVTRFEHPQRCKKARLRAALCHKKPTLCRSLQREISRSCHTIKVKRFIIEAPDPTSKGRIYNSYLVSPNSKKFPRLGHTTGELFAGYGTLSRCPQSQR